MEEQFFDRLKENERHVGAPIPQVSSPSAFYVQHTIPRIDRLSLQWKVVRGECLTEEITFSFVVKATDFMTSFVSLNQQNNLFLRYGF